MTKKQKKTRKRILTALGLFWRWSWRSIWPRMPSPAWRGRCCI